MDKKKRANEIDPASARLFLAHFESACHNDYFLSAPCFPSPQRDEDKEEEEKENAEARDKEQKEKQKEMKKKLQMSTTLLQEADEWKKAKPSESVSLPFFCAAKTKMAVIVRKDG